MLTRITFAAAALAVATPAPAAKETAAAPVLAFINEAWNQGDFSHMAAAQLGILH